MMEKEVKKQNKSSYERIKDRRIQKHKRKREKKSTCDVHKYVGTKFYIHHFNELNFKHCLLNFDNTRLGTRLIPSTKSRMQIATASRPLQSYFVWQGS